MASLCLFFSLPVLAQYYDFDSETVYTSGQLRYCVDQERNAAQCMGFAEGQSATAVTVPATVSLSGKSYRVVSIGEGAFIQATELSEVHLLSTELTIGSLPFGGGLRHLYMSAPTPPYIDGSYLAIDLSSFQPPLVRVHVPVGSLYAYLDDEAWSQHIIFEGDEERQLAVITESAGSLGEAIRMQEPYFRAVNHLTVSGPLNEDDIFLIRDSLTSVLSLDLSQAIITRLPRQAFLRCKFSSILLPSTLRSVDSTPFGSCMHLEQLVIPEGVQQVDELVSNCPSLKQIDLPSTVVSAKRLLTVYSWDETSAYTCTITSRAFFPPQVDDELVTLIFGNTDIRLRVPAISASLYASATGWKELPQEPMSEVPQQIMVLGQRKIDTDDFPADYTPDLSLVQAGNYSSYSLKNAFGWLTIEGSKPLKVNNLYVCSDIFATRSWGDHYGGELLAQAPVSARHLCMDLDFSSDTWYFMSFPFDVRLSNVTPSSDINRWVVRSYSGSNRAYMRGEQWKDVPYGATLQAHHGYIWRMATSDPDSYGTDDLRVRIESDDATINNMFTHEDVSIPLSEYASTYEHNASWNLVGNPYPCHYRIGDLKQTMPITVWKGNYDYDQYRTLSPIDDADKMLRPYEAFFLQKPSGADALVFGAQGRVVPGNSAASARIVSSTNGCRQVINLTLTAGDMSDQARVVLNPDASEGYERERDASKFFASSQQVPQLYSFVDAEPCAINERPEANGTIRLGIRMASEQTCTITMEPSAQTAIPVILEDCITGTYTTLSEVGHYTFHARPGRDDSRFMLHVGVSAITGIQSAELPMRQPVHPTFNLQGQPVSDGYKGLVIENGKLIIKQ